MEGEVTPVVPFNGTLENQNSTSKKNSIKGNETSKAEIVKLDEEPSCFSSLSHCFGKSALPSPSTITSSAIVYPETGNSKYDGKRSSMKRNSQRRGSVTLKKLEKIPRFIIMPNSTLRMRWDLGILVLVIYFGIAVPMRLAFESEGTENPVADGIDTAAIVLFSIDMVLNFRTSYKSMGIYVTDAKRIAWKYATTWFFIDLVATLPLDELLGDNSNGNSFSQINRVLRLIRIFKLFRVFRISRILSRIEEFTKFNPAMIRLMKLFLSMVITWHWIACFYWFLSDFEHFGFEDIEFTTPSPGITREGGNQWVPPPELWCTAENIGAFKCNETAFEDFEQINGYNPFKGIDYCIALGHCTADFNLQYASAFFWAVMVTTGIGRDIMPVTWLEHTFSTVMILLGVMMYAVIIGSASSALSSLDSDSTEKRRKLENINTYMRQRNVPHPLRKKVREYYEYMWSSHQSLNEEDGVMGDLHETLRLQVHIALNKKLIQSIPMFTLISDSQCLIDIIEKLKPKIFIPGEFICLAGDIGSDLYIVVRGLVHVLVGPELKFVTALADGEVFGELSLITREKRNASIRAITYCETLVLSKEDFDDVLTEHPTFFNSLQKTTGKKFANASAWDSIRRTIKMVKASRVFGVSVNMRESLLSSGQELEKQLSFSQVGNTKSLRKRSKSKAASNV